MARWFNTAGPCKPGYHYMLPPARRVPQLPGLIDQMQYFVLHAPRQTGKTTILQGLADELTAAGRYAAVWVSAEQTLGDLPRDDQRFVLDLGLVRWTDEGGLEVANPIYREVIVRELAQGPRASLPKLRATWLDPQGRLDPDALCDALLAFWRQHGDALRRSAPYHEVAAQLVLMAFLHRVVNGGGSIEREYAIGRGRMDLCLRLGDVTLAMELKVWGNGRPDPRADGLPQLDGYLDGLGLATGWLVIFDERSQAEATVVRTRRERVCSPAGREITVIRA
ncbi:MAG TPA: hypothetical protein VHT91_01595 [Kofleriaceae bacterium]|nr:hypothetical protein [Kofleriaceae bacterium]